MTGRPKPILVIEDDAEVLRMLTRFFSRAGLEVLPARDEEEARRLFKPGRFALILADVDLGNGADGIAVARDFLREEPGLRVVMMSGEPANAGRVCAAGLGPFLRKPFDLSRLVPLCRWGA